MSEMDNLTKTMKMIEDDIFSKYSNNIFIGKYQNEIISLLRLYKPFIEELHILMYNSNAGKSLMRGLIMSLTNLKNSMGDYLVLGYFSGAKEIT